MSQVKAIPDGFHSITPHLVCAGASDAMDFYKRAFNAVELTRALGPDGKIMNASMRIGNSIIMVVDEFPQWGSFGPTSLKGTPVTIHLYVEDADKAAAQAVAAGAKTIMPVAEMFWGDRYGVFEDPCGHKWSIATHVADKTQAQVDDAIKAMAANLPPDAHCGDNNKA